MARSRPEGFSATEAYYILCLVVFLVTVIFAFVGPGGFLEMKTAQRELETHRARVENLRRTNSERMQSIEKLKTDKSAQEEYAREQGYARKDEIIQRVQREPSPSKTTPPARKP